MSRRLDDKRKTVKVNGKTHSSTLIEDKRQRHPQTTDSETMLTCLNGVNNLRPKCEQTFRLILSNISSESALVYEKQLWNDIKQYRHQKDSFLIQYLIGFYVSLMESIVTNGRHKEPYSLLYNSQELSSTTRLLLYNILIRIGDLNRYLNKTSVSETYYLNARKLDVLRGHAYNQLAINTPMSQQLKCIYYYCRAAKSCVEPILIAETNLKVAANRFDSGILKSIIKIGSNSNEALLDFDEQLVLTYPQKGIDWFYLSVISVYSDNFDTIFKHLIDFLITNCELTSNKHLENDINNDMNFALMAFDVALDWIGLKTVHKTFFDVYAKELRNLKTALKTCAEVIREYEDQNEDQSEGESKPLFHDYVLRGFSPLTPIHDKLEFGSNETLVIQSYRLMSRVIHKMDKLFGKSMKPKRMRNVALGSILENESND